MVGPDARIRGRDRDNLRPVGLAQRLARHHLLPVKHAPGQVQPEPVGEIAQVGADATRRRRRIIIRQVAGCPDPVGRAVVRCGPVLPAPEIREAITGAGHPQRCEQPRLGQVFPRLIRRPRRRVGASAEPQIGVRPGGAKGGGQGVGAEPSQALVAIVAKIGDQRITAVGRQARAMAEHVADGDLLAHPRVGEREAGIEAADRGIPGRHAVADDGGDQRGGERLRQRGDLEDRLRRDRLRLAQLAHAEAAFVDHLIVVDHRHRRAGDPGLGHAIFDQGVEAVHGGLDLGGGDCPLAARRRRLVGRRTRTGQRGDGGGGERRLRDATT